MLMLVDLLKAALPVLIPPAKIALSYPERLYSSRPREEVSRQKAALPTLIPELHP